MSLLLRARRWSGILSLLLLTAATAAAQSTAGYGDWQLHLPNNRARALADNGSRIYVAAEDAFFFFDKDLNTTQLLSRRDGLHDVGVSTVAYDAATKQTLVAYRNGNLDLIGDDGVIRNVSDILRKPLTGSKAISHISFNARLAYLSCSFGLVVLDMVKREVRDTYSNIGPNGKTAEIFATAVANGNLFAATSFGVMRGKLTDNLVDYRRWTIDLPDNSGRNRYHVLATQGDRVYTGYDFGNLFFYAPNSTGWQQIYAIYAEQFQQLTPSAAGLLVVSSYANDFSLNLLKADNANTATRLSTAAQIPQPRMAVQDKSGVFYVADAERGLLRSPDGQQVESFTANAPSDMRVFSLLADAHTNTVDVFSGGYSEGYVQNGYVRGGFHEYSEGRWTSFTTATYPNPADYPRIKDLTRGVRTPDGTLYIATYGDGLLQWKGTGKFKRFTQGTPGVPLISAAKDNDPAYTRVTDLATDANGSLWLVNRHDKAGISGLVFYNPGADTWRRSSYFPGAENLDRLALDDNGYVWASQARLGGSGMVCYDDKTKNNRYFGAGGDGLPSGLIYDVVKDRKGDIWVGTGKGVAFFSDPSQAFLTGAPGNFQTPFVRRGITTGFPALRDEVVRAIAVDGGNRKWFGTDRGLWLFDEDGYEALLHFTTDNSPLPTNNIVDIDINDRTGEVFVGTTGGVVTYRGSATVTEGEVSCAKVSPNPVRTDFMGEVGISGLANNGYVKITDVTGKLVYQTRPSGGTVVWNLTDYNGRKVQSGVYLVMSSDADGKNGCISKVAVVSQ